MVLVSGGGDTARLGWFPTPLTLALRSRIRAAGRAAGVALLDEEGRRAVGAGPLLGRPVRPHADRRDRGLALAKQLGEREQLVEAAHDPVDDRDLIARPAKLVALEGLVTGVTYRDGIALLNVNGQQLPLASVLEVKEG